MFEYLESLSSRAELADKDEIRVIKWAESFHLFLKIDRMRSRKIE